MIYFLSIRKKAERENLSGVEKEEEMSITRAFVLREPIVSFYLQIARLKSIVI